MPDINEISPDYLNQINSSSTVTSTEPESTPDITENLELNLSKKAEKAIDEAYKIDSESTQTDDIKTYKLKKPRREIIIGIRKND